MCVLVCVRESICRVHSLLHACMLVILCIMCCMVVLCIMCCMLVLFVTGGILCCFVVLFRTCSSLVLCRTCCILVLSLSVAVCVAWWSGGIPRSRLFTLYLPDVRPCLPALSLHTPFLLLNTVSLHTEFLSLNTQNVSSRTHTRAHVDRWRTADEREMMSVVEERDEEGD
jgi:hypothetical protein